MFKNRVREIRKMRKLTIDELAQKLGEPYSTVQKIDKGTVDLDTTWMEKLAKVLNVEPYELLPIEWQPKNITPEQREALRVLENLKESSLSNANKNNTKENINGAEPHKAS